jgi:hypothetical protein
VVGTVGTSSFSATNGSVSSVTRVGTSNAYTVVLFRDQSRVTVMPNTEFRVDRLIYEESAPEAGEGFFSQRYRGWLWFEEKTKEQQRPAAPLPPACRHVSPVACSPTPVPASGGGS